MFYFDPVYFIFVGPALLLAMWAQFKVKSAYHTASQIRAASGMSGAEVASQILAASGVPGVGIEQTQGFLGDHYDPKKKVLRLSPDVYSGRSLAALGIAAHEAGHALQDAQRYGLLVLRNGIVPLASVGSNLSYFVIFGGFIMNSVNLVVVGVLLF
ncbi:MAG: zinc metallopeptidase, partial [Bdellovibrionales bacterium]|nr:zinc metallopeptidase [Bdellovibrionales bacterium]